MSQVISPDQALALVLERAHHSVTETESVALESALGRRIAAAIVALEPWPTTDRSAMDGFACATGGAGIEAGTAFPVVGEALAGHPFTGGLSDGQAVRIMTGGVVPAGADVVVPVEDSSGYEGGTVEVQAAFSAGANIRPEGSEIAVGDELLAAGTRIRGAEVSALATLGRVKVDVLRRPSVAILATGDEVVPIDTVPDLHQVRDSNAWALAAQTVTAGGIARRLGVAADAAADLGTRIRSGLDNADILLTIGGVSKGTHDLVHGTLRELGVETVFHGISLKPGKPLFFGVKPAGEGAATRPTFVFGLPGNPASASTTFDLFVRPALLRLAGSRADLATRALLPLAAGAVFKSNWRTQAVPARRVVNAAGEAELVLGATRPSGDPFGLCEGDGYALLPGGETPDGLGRGPVPFVPFDVEGT